MYLQCLVQMKIIGEINKKKKKKGHIKPCLELVKMYTNVQDNILNHTAKAALELLKTKNLNVWPDFDPVPNMWQDLCEIQSYPSFQTPDD